MKKNMAGDPNDQNLDTKNFDPGESESEKGLKALFSNMYDKLCHVFGDVKVQEMSYDDIIVRLQVKLNGMDSPVAVNYVRAVYDDYFVYEICPGEQSESRSEPMLYKRGYEVEENGQISLADDVTPVIQKTEYVAVNNVSGDSDPNNPDLDGPKNSNKRGDNKMSDNKTGCCEEKVTQLIENEASKFDENDREWLTSLTEEQIDKLVPEKAAEPVKPAVNKVEKNDLPKDQKKEDPPLVTFKDLLETADPKVKEKIEYGFASYDTRRAELVELITSHEESDYTAEELEGMSITSLEKLGKLAGATVKANYEGRVGGHASMKTHSIDEVEPMPALGFTQNK